MIDPETSIDGPDRRRSSISSVSRPGALGAAVGAEAQAEDGDHHKHSSINTNNEDGDNNNHNDDDNTDGKKQPGQCKQANGGKQAKGGKQTKGEVQFFGAEEGEEVGAREPLLGGGGGKVDLSQFAVGQHVRITVVSHG